MAKGINKVIIIGNLGRDPETRYMPNGTAVTNVTVATSESWKDKQSGQMQERTEWHKVVFYQRLAEIAGEFLKKGSKVYIEGKLRTRSYEKDGQKHYSTEIIADQMQMLDGRPGGAGDDTGDDHGFDQPARGRAPAPAAGGGGGDDGGFSDDIPFRQRTSNYAF